MGLTTPHSKKLIVTKVEQRVLFDRPKPTASCSTNGRRRSFVILHLCIYLMYLFNDSHWPRGLRRRSAAARLLRSWVRIPPGAWMFVCGECCVLSGRGLCDELITSPEESYRLWCVVVCDLETSRVRRP